MTSVIVVGTARLRADRADEARKLITSVVERSRQEPGCLSHEAHEAVGDSADSGPHREVGLTAGPGQPQSRVPGPADRTAHRRTRDPGVHPARSRYRRPGHPALTVSTLPRRCRTRWRERWWQA
ncbi:putative quinol monooxygenase [Streptomyces longisporoflavus]|uniref:putative quinol monooxygenase n=1 Tax=Streptomyces longisporoflavus TaxID=28044 RepID=UPI00167E5F6A